MLLTTYFIYRLITNFIISLTNKIHNINQVLMIIYNLVNKISKLNTKIKLVNII